jgi:hypothetical protein
MFAWSLAFGIGAAVLGWAIQSFALILQEWVERYRLPVTVVVGIAVAGIAILFAQRTGYSTSFVLFSGQNQMSELLTQATTWSVGTVVFLCACKAVAYSVSLSGFRGGPVFPAIFVGAAAGIAASHLPGMELIPAVGMGIGAMCASMLKLPMTSVLLATLLLGADGIKTMPVVIVAVVISFVAVERLDALSISPMRPKSTDLRAAGQAAD